MRPGDPVFFKINKKYIVINVLLLFFYSSKKNKRILFKNKINIKTNQKKIESFI